jgi:hypothetical protein
MERNCLRGEKWGRNELKTCFQKFLQRPVRTLAENATFCQARPDTDLALPYMCREMKLLTNPSGHTIGLSGHKTHKLYSKCYFFSFYLVIHLISLIHVFST